MVSAADCPVVQSSVKSSLGGENIFALGASPQPRRFIVLLRAGGLHDSIAIRQASDSARKRSRHCRHHTAYELVGERLDQISCGRHLLGGNARTPWQPSFDEAQRRGNIRRLHERDPRRPPAGLRRDLCDRHRVRGDITSPGGHQRDEQRWPRRELARFSRANASVSGD